MIFTNWCVWLAFGFIHMRSHGNCSERALPQSKVSWINFSQFHFNRIGKLTNELKKKTKDKNTHIWRRAHFISQSNEMPLAQTPNTARNRAGSCTREMHTLDSLFLPLKSNTKYRLIICSNGKNLIKILYFIEILSYEFWIVRKIIFIHCVLVFTSFGVCARAFGLNAILFDFYDWFTV